MNGKFERKKIDKKVSMLTIEEASDMCGLSYYVVRRFLIRNQFTGYIKTGSKYLINQELFEAFLRGELNESDDK